MKTALYGIGLGLALAAGGAYFYSSSSGSVGPVDQTVTSHTAKQTTLSSPLETSEKPEQARLVNLLAVDLLERYGYSVHDRRTQVMLLKERARILRDYPEQGAELFGLAVAVAFPELADQILQRVALMAEYESWLESNQVALNDLPLLQRSDMIWEKRIQLFGEDAGVIWAEEKQAWMQKEQKVQSVMQELDQARDMTLDEKIFQLKTALTDTYGDSLDVLGVSREVIAQTFFSFESVQERLKSLPDESRQEEINRLRRQMDYSEEEVARLAARDRESNEQWSNGLEYMAAREALEQSYDGLELEQKLELLRKEYFGNEAVTIALEEKDGFFRYQRRRVYGRN